MMAPVRLQVPAFATDDELQSVDALTRELWPDGEVARSTRPMRSEPLWLVVLLVPFGRFVMTFAKSAGEDGRPRMGQGARAMARQDVLGAQDT
jgi:hypothetical protein